MEGTHCRTRPPKSGFGSSNRAMPETCWCSSTVLEPTEPFGIRCWHWRPVNGRDALSYPTSEIGLWVEQSGDAGDVLVLIHGLGANGAVWDPLLALAAGEWKGRIVVPDLRNRALGRAIGRCRRRAGAHPRSWSQRSRLGSAVGIGGR